MSNKITLSQMPQGFFPLYFIQLFSTLSFAVMYSTLVLYMKEKLGLSSQDATIITGVYFAYNFSLHLLAGAIGGRYFSYRILVVIESIFQLIGCLFLSKVSLHSLYVGLALMLVGTGTMVTCINMMLSQLFEATDQRREFAFLWNYSRMNIGFVLGFFLAGYYQLTSNYHALFVATAVPNILVLILQACYWRHLKDRYTTFSLLNKKQRIRNTLIGSAILAALVPSIYVLLHHTHLSDNLVLVAGVVMFLFLFGYALRCEPKVRNKLFAFICLLLFGQIFWIIYQLAPMGLTLFARYNVERHVLGIIIAPAWIQNINSFTIIIGGPILALLFKTLRAKKINISFPAQYALGLFLAAIGLLILPIGIAHASSLGYMPFYWLFVTYVLQAIAELCLGPIGYSMVGALGPKKLQSIMMGMVLLNAGIAAVLASYFSNYALGNVDSTNPLITNYSFSHSFFQLGTVTLVVSAVLFMLTPLIMKKLIRSK